MNLDAMFAMPGLVVLVALCLMALFAALGIAVVSGFSGAAIMYFLQARARTPKGGGYDSTRMWEELAKSAVQDKDTL
jgi:hypothetical protein